MATMVRAMGFVVLCLANVFSTGFSATRDALHNVSIHHVFLSGVN